MCVCARSGVMWRSSLLSRALLPALSFVQTCLLHLLDMNWEVHDLPLFLNIKLPDLLLSMAQDNISVHDIAIRYQKITYLTVEIKCFAYFKSLTVCYSVSTT